MHRPVCQKAPKSHGGMQWCPIPNPSPGSFPKIISLFWPSGNLLHILELCMCLCICFLIYQALNLYFGLGAMQHVLLFIGHLISFASATCIVNRRPALRTHSNGRQKMYNTCDQRYSVSRTQHNSRQQTSFKAPKCIKISQLFKNCERKFKNPFLSCIILPRFYLIKDYINAS